MTLRDDFLIAPAHKAQTHRRGSLAAGLWIRLLGELNSPDFLVVLYFCAAGLLLNAAFIRMFPNFGELVALLNVFP